MSKRLEILLTSASDFYIFGAGNTAQKVKRVLQSKGKIVSSFIISSKPPDQQQIDGILIKSITNSTDFDINLPVIIAIFNREANAFLPDIIAKLRALGFNKLITYPEFHSFFSAELCDNFWLTNKNFYSQNSQNYYDILPLLNDQVSKEVFSSLIKYLETFDPFILKKANFNDQYFPNDINVWDGKGAFFDIGSYDGENIFDAYKAKRNLELVVALEPDLINFNKIVNNKKLKNIARQFFLYPCGAWSETTMVRFKSGVGESSSQCEDGDQIIPVIKIDDAIHARPGYLKMDVEGAEIEALLGAKNTISEFRPSLAISLYHHPDHFYSIPKLIQDWDLGYKFYVRLHGNNFFDTVLYCIH